MATKRQAAASKENQHPIVKKLKTDTPNKRASTGRRPKTEFKDVPPKLKHNTGPGIVLTCGQGDIGQLGLGPDVLNKSRFSLVPDLDNVVEIAAGGMHTVCLTEEGKVYTWGCNDEGALGREAEGDSEFVPQAVQLDKKAVQITAGDSHSVALLENGTVCAWGSFRDSHGSMGLRGKEGIQKIPIQIESNGKPLNNIVKIASGADHFVMLNSRGILYSTGCAEQGQLGRVPQRSASRNARHGIMSCLDIGEVKVPRKIQQLNDVYAGLYSTVMINKNSKQTLACGLNNYSQLGLDQPTSSGSSENINTCFYNPVLIPPLSDKSWSMFALGQHHTIALDEDGVTYALGRHDYGRLGLKNVTEAVSKPTPIPALQDKKVKFIAAGNCVSFAVDADGNLYGWGMGDNSQLGNGEEEDVLEPTKITGKQLDKYTVLQVASGGQHSVILVKPK